MWGIRAEIFVGPYDDHDESEYDSEFLSLEPIFNENVEITLTASRVDGSWEGIKKEFVFQFSKALNTLERKMKERGENGGY